MRIGKLTNAQLKRMVLSKLQSSGDVLLSPAVGEDCAALDFSGEACVLSTDPITGASENIGALAVHVSGNDVASSGARPSAMLVTMLVPPDKTPADVEKVADELIETAGALGIDIIGGHTEVTDAVSRIVVSTTVIGRIPADKMITSSGAKAGDSLIMTKQAAIEGTYIIAAEHETELAGVLTDEERDEAARLIAHISVIEDGVAAGRSGATAMHDVTEGGIYGAAHELCEASGVGCDINVEKIPVMEITKKICAHFNIDAYRLIGSGSMLITTPEPHVMLSALQSANIAASHIGQITSGDVCEIRKGQSSVIAPPQADALFSV